jgi:hypothetical protein
LGDKTPISSDSLFWAAMSMRLLAASVPVVEGSDCSNKAAAPATSVVVQHKVDSKKEVSKDVLLML